MYCALPLTVTSEVQSPPVRDCNPILLVLAARRSPTEHKHIVISTTNTKDLVHTFPVRLALACLSTLVTALPTPEGS